MNGILALFFSVQMCLNLKLQILQMSALVTLGLVHAGVQTQFLVQDFNIKCNEGEHVTFVAIAIGFLLLYIVGIPLTMLVLLCRNRKHLHDEQSPQHRVIKNALGGLYIQCE